MFRFSASDNNCTAMSFVRVVQLPSSQYSSFKYCVLFMQRGCCAMPVAVDPVVVDEDCVLLMVARGKTAPMLRLNDDGSLD